MNQVTFATLHLILSPRNRRRDRRVSRRIRATMTFALLERVRDFRTKFKSFENKKGEVRKTGSINE